MDDTYTRYITSLCRGIRGKKRTKAKIETGGLGKQLRKSTIKASLEDFVRYRGLIDNLAEKVEQAGAKLYETVKKTYEFLDYSRPKKPEEEYTY